MSKIFKLASLAAVFSLAFSVVSCKKEDSQKSYSWSLTRTSEAYFKDASGNNDVKTWVDAAIMEIQPKVYGSGAFSDESQLQTIKSTAEDAVSVVGAAFAEAKKIHDFGKYGYKAVFVFKIGDKDGKDVYVGPEHVIDYPNTIRFESEYAFNEENFTKKMALVKDMSLQRTISYNEMHLDPDVDAKVAGTPLVFDSETKDVYMGTSFIAAIEMEENGLNVVLHFKKENADDYPGSWYILVPLEQKGAGVEKIDVLIKVILK